jgi:hypothetical protein
MVAGRFRSVVVAASVLAVAGGALAAEGEGAGQLVAFACGKMPERPRLDVQLFDDTPRDKAVRDAIAQGLARDGYTIAADGRVRVSFEGAMERDLDPGREGHFGRLNSTNRETTFTLNMWSSQGDSVIGGPQRPGATAPSFYRLAVFVHDKTNGACLWQGEARHPLEGHSEADIARRLVPVTLRHFGRTVPPTAFALDD